MDLALNYLQRLICHKTQTTNGHILFYWSNRTKYVGWWIEPYQVVDRTLSGPTTSGQSEPGFNGNKGVLYFPQIKWSNIICRTFIGRERLTLLQRCSRCIQQPQSTGLCVCVCLKSCFRIISTRDIKIEKYIKPSRLLSNCLLWISILVNRS